MTARTMSETLRAVADLIESHPDLPLPYVCVYDHTPYQADLNWYLQINQRSEGEAHQRAQALAIVRGIGGKWRKDVIGDSFRFEQEIDGLNLDVQVTREAVCERVVVGEETVVIPAVEARPERIEKRDVVQWRCEPLLAEAAS